MERTGVVYARSNYLRKIHQYRQDGRFFIFLDVALICNNLNIRKCWRNEMIDTVFTDTRFRNRLILVQPGSRGGFLKRAKLLFEAGTTSGDYHDF